VIAIAVPLSLAGKKPSISLVSVSFMCPTSDKSACRALGNPSSSGIPIQIVLKVDNPSITDGTCSASVALVDDQQQMPLTTSRKSANFKISKQSDGTIQYDPAQATGYMLMYDRTVVQNNLGITSGFLDAQLTTSKAPFTLRVSGSAVCDNGPFSHSIDISIPYSFPS